MNKLGFESLGSLPIFVASIVMFGANGRYASTRESPTFLNSLIENSPATPVNRVTNAFTGLL